jgi:hypothetical protein
MVDQIVDDIPADFPRLPTSPAPFRILAAASREGHDGIFQTYLFVHHDVVGSITCLAPDDAQSVDGGWDMLEKLWDERAGYTGDLGGALGEALVLSALSEGPGATTTASAAKISGPPFISRDGFAVYTSDTANPRRRFLVLGPEEGQLDGWLWWRGRTSLPPFAACVMHAAKIRYEADIYEREVASVHRAVAALGGELDALFTSLEEIDSKISNRVSELASVEARISQRSTDSTALQFSVTLLSDLQRTITIACENLRILSPSVDEPKGGVASPFSADVALAEHVSRQIEHDRGYATATLARAREAVSLTRLRLDFASQQLERERNRLILIQTTSLGSLLAALAAVDALHFQIPVRGALHMPLIALVMAVTFAFPLLLTHWHEGYTAVDVMAAATLTAILGWLLMSVMSGPHGAAPWASLTGAAVGALIGTIVILAGFSRNVRRRRWPWFGRS